MSGTLDERINDLENQVEALVRLPQRVVAINDGLNSIADSIRVLRIAMESRLEDLDKKTSALVIEDTDEDGQPRLSARKVGADWKLMILFASTCIVPIVVAILTTR